MSFIVKMVRTPEQKARVNELRRNEKIRRRQAYFVSEYINAKYFHLYREATNFFNALNTMYPTKSDLRKTVEFRNWRTAIITSEGISKPKHPYQTIDMTCIQNERQSPQSHQAESFESHQVQSFESHQAESPESHQVESFESHQAESPESHQVQSFESHQAESPESHQVESFESHQAESPESHQVESFESHQAESPESHQVESFESHQAESPESHQAESPESHQTESPESQQAESPESHQTESPESHQAESRESHGWKDRMQLKIPLMKYKQKTATVTTETLQIVTEQTMEQSDITVNDLTDARIEEIIEQLRQDPELNDIFNDMDFAEGIDIDDDIRLENELLAW